MKIEFKTLKVKNFLSFGNKQEVFDLSKEGVTNLKGRNLDVDVGKDNSSANGAGKSAGIQAIVYALYGKGVEEGMKQDEFINLTNGKNMEVILEFTLDGKECSIVRTRKPNNVQFFYDGDDVSRDSIANTNALIEESIGINYDTFVVSYLMTNGVQPLLSRKPADQRNFFEKLLNMDLLSKRAKAVKAIKDDLKVDLRLVEKDIEHADETNKKADDQYQRTISKYEEYEKQRETDVEKLQSKLERSESAKAVEKDAELLFEKRSNVKETIQDLQKKISDIQSQRSSLVDAISKNESFFNDSTTQLNTKSAQLKETEQHLEDLQEELDKYQKEESKLSEKAREIEEMLNIREKIDNFEADVEKTHDHIERQNTKKSEYQQEKDHLEEGTCPYCKQKWSDDEQKKRIENLKKSIQSIDEDINECSQKIDEFHDRKSELETEIQSYITDDDECNRIVNEYQEASDNVIKYKNLISDSQKKQTKLKSEVEEIEAKLDEVDLDAVSQQISDDNDKIEDVDLEIENLQEFFKESSEQLEEVENKINDLHGINEKTFRELISSHNHYQQQLEQTQKAVNPFEEDYRAGPQGKVNVDESKAQKGRIENEVRHCEYMAKLLTDSKSFIRKSIINRYIPYLNKKINTYAESLDSPHFTEIQPDLTVDVEYMRKSVSYHSLSAGERLRLNVSVSLALRDLMSTLGVNGDFLMVDELFDSSLDSNGKMNVFNTIRNRLNSIILVSHSGEFDDKCDYTITAVKENGFTRLK